MSKELVVRTDRGVSLFPHAGQQRVWDSTARFILMLAGTQSGKTSFAPWWLAREIQRCGAGDYLAVTSSFDLFKLKLLPEMLKVFVDILKVGRYWAGSRVIELVDNTGRFTARHADDVMHSRIILRSVQSKGGLESATAKAAIFDEAGQDIVSLEDWEAIQRRLSIAKGRALIPTTPYNLGWLKHELYDPWAQGETTDIDIIQFPSTMNPSFPQDEYDRMKSRMQDWRFSLFYGGLFSTPPAMIYGCVKPAHWEESFTIPWNWHTVVGVDPSGGHCATLWLAMNPETQVWHAFHETLEHSKTTKENVADAVRAFNLRDIEYVGGGPSEDQERRDWGDQGTNLQAPAVSGVDAGIDRAVGLFKQNRIKLSHNLVMLREELGSYKRKTDVNGTPLNEILDKSRFHLLDCLRAAAVHIEDGNTAGQELEAYFRGV